MQFDEQQNVDPSDQDTPFDPYRRAAGDQADDTSTPVDNRAPGRPYTGQPRQAAGQGIDSLQQQQGIQGAPDMGNLGDTLQQQSQPGLGGMGEMVSRQPGQVPPVGASGDPNNPYGSIDNTIVNYGNGQNDPGQQGITNI